MWGSIIAQLITVLGPVLVEFLKKWLDDKLKTAAKKMETNFKYPTGLVGNDCHLLLKEVYDSLWFFEVRRKKFVIEAMRTAPAMVVGLPVTGERMDALKAAATLAA
jgi:hypothetical protein